jgi:hypothetical protein
MCFPLALTPAQTERAYQKQPTVFLWRKGGVKKADSRYVKNPGLGFKVPREVTPHFCFVAFLTSSLMHAHV